MEKPLHGAEENHEGSWISAGKLACSEKPPGHFGGGEPDGIEKDW